MKPLIILWKFSRPHTVIGSVVSILTLYFIVCDRQQTQNIPYLLMALLIGISCNIFIVGINQIADVKIDHINKPDLPIPSGVLNIRQAKSIVAVSLILSLAVSLFISTYLFWIVALAAFIGWAYSMPPLHLKRHHISAALAITTVRGVLLNAGGFMVFNYLVNQTLEMPQNVKILTMFIVAFSIAIAWFKDLPDIAGDSQYNIKTLAISYSPRATLIAGNLLVGLAYLLTIYMKFGELSNQEIPTRQTTILLFGHVFLFLLFIMNTFAVRLSEHKSIKKYYKRFWYFFFAEYLLYLIAYTV